MASKTTPKPKTIVTPEFTCGRALKATVSEQLVTLERDEDGSIVTVSVQVAPALPMKIGSIYKSGTGWTAVFVDDDATPSFIGDRYPTRTGKHTQMYAVCYLLARAAGFGASDATYNLKYDGVKA